MAACAAAADHHDVLTVNTIYTCTSLQNKIIHKSMYSEFRIFLKQTKPVLYPNSDCRFNKRYKCK